MRATLAAALAVMALVGAGCSVGKPEPPKNAATTGTSTGTTTVAGSDEDAPPRYISEKEIDELPEDSPARSILMFWQAAQYKNMLVAYDLLSRDFQDQFAGTLPRFSKFIAADIRHFLVAQPKIVSEQEDGSNATVIISYRAPGGIEDRSAVSLVRERGEWRIAFLFYLANRLRGQ
jgi:hypothetical protein